MDLLAKLEKKAGRKLETGADIRQALRTYGFPNIARECPKCGEKYYWDEQEIGKDWEDSWVFVCWENIENKVKLYGIKKKDMG